MSGNGIVFILPHPSGEVVSAFDVPNPSGGEASGATGLSRIDGLGSFDPSYTGTRLGEVLKTGRTHTVIARVAPGIDGTVRITVGLDGNELYSWEGPSKSLSLFPAWKINQPRWPAIGAYRGTTVEFDKLDMKILDGDATVYAPPAAATQSASQPAGTTGPTTLPAK